MIEKAIKFGAFKSLVGIISEPTAPLELSRPAVIISNAGLIHRIGPNRIYVKLARMLAAQGFVVLRLDLSGVGDSLPRPDHMPVEQFTIDDLVQAMDYLTHTYGMQRFVLMGHCAGAFHSFRTAAQDRRVSGVVMMNPDGSETDWVDYDRKRKLARYYENYYIKRTLLDSQRWKRFFNGQISYRDVFKNILINVVWYRISGLFFRIKRRFGPPAPPQASAGQLFSIEAILTKLYAMDIQMMLIYSANSTGLERIQTGMGKALKQLKTAGKLDFFVVPGADHIFSPLATQLHLSEIILRWFERYPAENQKV